MKLPIPGTDGYEVDDNAVVYRKDGTVGNTYHNGDGYVTTLIVTTDGEFRTVGVHRLVAMTFKNDDMAPEKSHVNHLDGDKENNRPSNLDWDTPANNNLHQSLMRRPGRPNALVLTGKELVYFSNLHEASAYLKLQLADVWFMVRDCTEFQGCFLRINKNLGPDFYQDKIKARDTLGRQPQRSLKMLNVVSGEVKEGHASELARYFNTSASHITTTVTKDDEIRIFKNDWIIVDGNSDFPQLTDDELARLRERGRPKPVLSIDKSENVLCLYPSAASFVQVRQLSKKAVTTRLRNQGFGKIGNLVFCYAGLLTVDQLKEL